MATTVIMPRQGQSVESCIITEWKKKKGDSVAVGDILFSYETDKSAFDEPAQAAGVLLEIMALEGDVVPCLDPVCVIGQAGEDISALISGKDTAKTDKTALDIQNVQAVKAEPVATTAEASADGRVKISPRAKKLALKTAADMKSVVPTGPGGRIIERDVNAALNAGNISTTASVEAFLRGEAGVAAAPCEADEASAKSAAFAEVRDFREYTEEPMSGIRRSISKTMHASLSDMAQLTLNASFDATSLFEYRRVMKENGEAMGLCKITINDMVLFAVSRTILLHPEINSNLIGDKIRTYAHAHIGLAVDTDRGLLVPTVFAADTLSLSALAAKTKVCAKSAKDGTLKPDEMSGASFTVTNLGSLGVESFTPVINPPQCAILGVCASVNRLRPDGSVYPAMGLSLTFDHRAVDGAPAARFLKDLCTSLENFQLLLAK